MHKGIRGLRSPAERIDRAHTEALRIEEKARAIEAQQPLACTGYVRESDMQLVHEGLACPVHEHIPPGWVRVIARPVYADAISDDELAVGTGADLSAALRDLADRLKVARDRGLYPHRENVALYVIPVGDDAADIFDGTATGFGYPTDGEPAGDPLQGADPDQDHDKDR